MNRAVRERLFLRSYAVELLLKLGALGVVLGACSAFSSAPEVPLEEAHDAGPSGITGEDAAGGDSSTPSACAALFCTAFDDDPFDGAWDGYGKGAHREVDIVLEQTEDAPRSGRRALRLSIPESSSLYQSNYLRKGIALPAGVRTLTYRFAMRVRTANTKNGDVRVAVLGWGKDLPIESRVAASFVLAKGDLTLRIGKGDVVEASTLTRRLETGRWYELAVTLTFNAADATVETFMDGSSYDKTSFTPHALPEGEAEVHLGAEYATADWSATSVDFDDVSFDAK